jgi:type 1 glutamine amidotransferase
MKTKFPILLLAGALILAGNLDAKYKALIIDGQNNHVVWPKSTIMMKQYLEETGLFKVEIDRVRYTWRGEQREGAWLALSGFVETKDLKDPQPDPDFSPEFAKYDVVISNFGNRASDWPEATQRALEDYMENGGGFVSVHAADNSFGQWEEYNRMIGLGGWGGRNEESGPYVYYSNAGDLVRDGTSSGGAGKHGPRHEFRITLRDATHPITKGLPAQWLTSEDECYAMLRGPAENMTVLATGKDVSGKAPTDRHEPMLMVIDYGKGRTFHTTLGHDVPALEGVGFITTFQRGTEWAASGKVTQPVPEDFPTKTETKSRPFTLKP